MHHDKDYYYLLKCLELAIESVNKGNHPFGALLVLDDKIVVSSENEVVTLDDVTQHAEMNLIKKAQKVLSKEELSRCVLYTSTEPCAMCSGAIYWGGISEVVYGCSVPQLNGIVDGGLSIRFKQVFDSGTRNYEYRDYSSDSIFQSVHLDFWQDL